MDATRNANATPKYTGRKTRESEAENQPSVEKRRPIEAMTCRAERLKREDDRTGPHLTMHKSPRQQKLYTLATWLYWRGETARPLKLPITPHTHGRKDG